MKDSICTLVNTYLIVRPDPAKLGTDSVHARQKDPGHGHAQTQDPDPVNAQKQIPDNLVATFVPTLKLLVE